MRAAVMDAYEPVAKLLTGTIIAVNDTAVKAELKGRMGIVTMPLRCVVTDKPLAVGQQVRLYISDMKVL